MYFLLAWTLDYIVNSVFKRRLVSVESLGLNKTMLKKS